MSFVNYYRKEDENLDRPLFSIVIAVYNVKGYLKKCLESVDRQMQNYEVIIIDDGSTDGSGTVCDDWAEKRNYVKVFHQMNQGISETRNKGVQYSSGDYIVFVDPDDWIEDNFTESLQKLIKNGNNPQDVDVIAYNLVLVTRVAGSYRYVKSGDVYPENVASGNEVVDWVLNTRVGNYACQYAVKRDIYIDNNIRFPKMELYEDAATMYKLIFYAKQVVCTNQVLYNYFQRNNSFSHLATLSRTTEYFKLFENMDTFFDNRNRQDLIVRSRQYKLMRLFSAYLNIIRLNMDKRKKKKYYKKIKHAITTNFVLSPYRKETLIKELLFYTHLFKPIAYIHDWRILK